MADPGSVGCDVGALFRGVERLREAGQQLCDTRWLRWNEGDGVKSNWTGSVTDAAGYEGEGTTGAATVGARKGEDALEQLDRETPQHALVHCKTLVDDNYFYRRW